MCGRFSLGFQPEELVETFAAEQISEPVPASYNIAPTDNANIISSLEGKVICSKMSWGFDLKGSAKVFNARLETLLEKWRFIEDLHDVLHTGSLFFGIECSFKGEFE